MSQKVEKVQKGEEEGGREGVSAEKQEVHNSKCGLFEMRGESGFSNFSQMQMKTLNASVNQK